MAETKDLRFNGPIELDLGKNPGPIIFTTLNDLEAWANAEAQAWGELPTDAIPAPYQSAAAAQKAAARNLMDAGRKYFSEAPELRESHLNQIRRVLGRYQREEVAHHRTAWGRTLKELWGLNPSEAAAALWARAQVRREAEGREPLTWLRDQQFQHTATLAVRGVVQSIVSSGGLTPELRAHARALEEAAAALEATIAAWRARDNAAKVEWESVKKRQGAEFEKHLKSITAKDDALVKASNDKILELTQLFQEKIRLEAPVQYWRDKEKVHKRGVMLWGFLSAGIAVAPIAAAVYYGPQLYEAFAKVQKDLSTGGVAILLVFAVLYLALGRQIARLFTTNLALSNDAAERVVMAQTFLALYQDKKLTEDERKLVLVPLFRPHGGGAEGDATAGLADLIAKAVSPSKP